MRIWSITQAAVARVSALAASSARLALARGGDGGWWDADGEWDGDGECDANGSGDGGGLSNAATLTARNSVIANNVDGSPAGSNSPDCAGTLVSAGELAVEQVGGLAGGALPP